MIIFTPDNTKVSDPILIEEVDEVMQELKQLKQELKAVRERLGAGEVEASAEHTRLVTTVRQIVVSAMDTEKRVNEHKRKEAGIGECGYGIDFNEARRAIGCKMAKLRRCCNTD